MRASSIITLFLSTFASAAVLPAKTPNRFSTRQSSAINQLLAAVTSSFPVNIAVTGLTDTISIAEQGLADALGQQTTRNDLQNGQCGDINVVFARGTTETGNVGLLTGPPFFDALEAAVQAGGLKVAVQGVDYGATIPEFLEGGDPTGSQTMATLIQQSLTNCPNAKTVVSGYSQGGQLVHNAAKIVGAADMAKVNSVVIFGDPDNGEAVTGVAAAKTKIICNTGDNICQHGDLILLPHLEYSLNATQATNFVLMQAGLQMGD